MRTPSPDVASTGQRYSDTPRVANTLRPLCGLDIGGRGSLMMPSPILLYFSVAIAFLTGRGILSVRTCCAL